MNTIILIGLVIVVVAYAAKSEPNRNKPAWSEHMKGWQKVFGFAAFILTILILINPEFLVLGLLGDAAFFDVMVLALSIQIRTVVFRVWRYLHLAYLKILSFAIGGVRREFSMIVLTLVPLGSAALKIRKTVIKCLRRYEYMLA